MLNVYDTYGAENQHKSAKRTSEMGLFCVLCAKDFMCRVDLRCHGVCVCVSYLF